MRVRFLRGLIIANIFVYLIVGVFIFSIPNETDVFEIPTQAILDSERVEPTRIGNMPSATSAPDIVLTIVSPTIHEMTPTNTALVQDTSLPVSELATVVFSIETEQILQEAIPEQIILHFTLQSTSSERQAYIDMLSGTVIQTIDALNIVVLRVPPNATPASLPSSPILADGESNFYVTMAQESVTVTDPLYSQQWALPVIGASDGWAAIDELSQELLIAVIDSGVVASHLDLTGRISTGWDFVEDDSTPQDEIGHGTAVTGIIAANADNGIGIMGVVPDISIMPLRVLDGEGYGTYAAVAAAIVYAADRDANIINLSLGGLSPSTILQEAVDYAIRKNVVIVAAAGNTASSQIMYPAAYPSVIAVGSVDEDLQTSSFSSTSNSIDLFAPGRSIITTSFDGDYALYNGTSFAAPYVTGIAALEMATGGTLIQDGGIVHFSGTTVLPPLPPTPDLPPSLNYIDEAVLDELAINGEANVIINLNLPVRSLSSDDVRTQAIIQAQDAVLSVLAVDDFSLHQQFVNISALAGTLHSSGVETLSTHPDVLSIYIDTPVSLHGTSPVAAIQAQLIYDSPEYGSTGQNVTVAVLDTGIDTDHREFAGRIIAQHCTTAVDCTSAEDLDGHGTNVAGILAGQSGIARDSNIVAIRVLTGAGGRTSDWIAGLDWLASHPELSVDVINLSLGTNDIVDGACDVAFARVFPDGLQLINELVEERGIVIVASSGNQGNWTSDRYGEPIRQFGVNAPACLSNIIAVGASYTESAVTDYVPSQYERIFGVDCNDTALSTNDMTCFTNVGSNLDILAPGFEIEGAYIDGRFAAYTGSSQAAPLISGLVALMKEDNPDLLPSTVLSLLRDNGMTSTMRDDYQFAIVDSLSTMGALTNSFCNFVTDISQPECEALVSLHVTSGGASWTNNAGWGVSTTACTWFGVTCTNGQVTALNLPANNLVGTISPTIGALRYLQRLDLSTNQLSGLPAEIGYLSDLEVLFLSDNPLNAPLPPEFGNLRSLQYLLIQRSGLTGGIPAELGNLSNIITLDLRVNPLGGSIPRQLTTLPQIENLILMTTNLTGFIPPQIGNLTTLKYLHLGNNHFQGGIPSTIGQLSNIEYLLLHNSQLSGAIPAEMGQLAQVKILSLAQNQLSGGIPVQLGQLSTLESLLLYDNQLAGTLPSELGQLSSLEAMLIQNNRLTGSIPLSFCNLSNLRLFKVANNLLTGDLPSCLTNWVLLSGLITNPFAIDVLEPTTRGDALALDYNALSADASLATFLSPHDPDWQNTQTIAPEIRVTGTTVNTLTIGITPIAFSDGAGHYEIRVLTESGANSITTTTPNKATTQVIIQGLAPNTSYQVIAQTVSNLGSRVVSSGFSEPILTSTVSTSFCDNVLEIPQSECLALEALYYSMDGDNWTNNSGWFESFSIPTSTDSDTTSGAATSTSLTPQNVIDVTTTNPNIFADGLCSLIEAIENANADSAVHSDCGAGGGVDSIVLQSGATYSLTSIHNDTDGANGLPSITSPIIIEGNNATIERITALDGSVSLRDAVLSSAGNPVMVAYDSIAGDLLLIVCFDVDCSSLTTKVIDSADDVGSSASIVLDSSNTPYIVYYDLTNQDLKFATCNDSTCTTPFVTTLGDGGQENPTITLNSGELPVISYNDNAVRKLYLLTCNDTFCSDRIRNEIDNGGITSSIAFANTGNPVIAYQQRDARELRIAICSDPTCTATPIPITLDEGGGNVGGWVSMALLNGDTPVIAYEETRGTGNDLLKFLACNTPDCASFSINIVDSGADFINYSLQLDGSRPVIAYGDNTSGSAKLIVCQDAACSSTTADTPRIVDSDSVGKTVLLLNGSNPIIPYMDSSNTTIKLARCVTPTCSSPTISRLGGQFRIFHVAGSGNLTVNNVTIQNGFVNNRDGAGIYNVGTLILDTVNVIDNFINESAAGGGIYSSGTATLIDTRVASNLGEDITAGGIYNAGVMDIFGSVIEDNFSRFYGGGIINTGTLTISDSTIADNRATRANGGGIHNTGMLTITDSLMQRNRSLQDNGGGGIYSSGTLIIEGSTIDDNEGFGGSGIEVCGGTATISTSSITNNNSRGDEGGGGIHVRCDSIVELNYVTVTNNTDYSGAGILHAGTGLLTIENSLIANNTATTDGGGISGRNMTIINSTIYNNTAENGTGGGFFGIDSSITIDFSTITENFAPQFGSGLQTEDSAVIVRHSIIADNRDGTQCSIGGVGSIDATGMSYATADCADYDPDFTTVLSSDLNLQPLGDYGGLVETVTLGADSVALDASDCTLTDGTVLDEDARGIARPQGRDGRCDAGAVEVEPTPCAWYGVTCEDGHVTEISMFNNGLVGVLPPAIGNLTELTLLRLVGNDGITGELPIEIGNLSNLRTLIISDANIRGSIPAQLSSLSNLEQIDLSGNNLAGQIPSELSLISNLRSIDLEDNQLSGGIPAELGNLTNLGQLVLTNNQISGEIPDSLGNTNLFVLYLGNNQLTGLLPDSLGNLTLGYLDVSDNRLSGTLSDIWDSTVSGGEGPGTISLRSNQFTGDLPPSFGRMLQGSTPDTFNSRLIDISYNALTVADDDPNRDKLLAQLDWQLVAQTVPPQNVSVTTSSPLIPSDAPEPGTLWVSWDAPPFQPVTAFPLSSTSYIVTASTTFTDCSLSTIPDCEYTHTVQVSGSAITPPVKLSELIGGREYNITVQTVTPARPNPPPDVAPLTREPIEDFTTTNSGFIGFPSFDMDFFVPFSIETQIVGSYSTSEAARPIWVLVYSATEDAYYPQFSTDPEGCIPTPLTAPRWSVPAYFGINDVQEQFSLMLAETTDDVNTIFTDWARDGCERFFAGIEPAFPGITTLPTGLRTLYLVSVETVSYQPNEVISLDSEIATGIPMGTIIPIDSDPDIIPGDIPEDAPESTDLECAARVSGDFASSFRRGDFASSFRRGDLASAFRRGTVDVQLTVESGDIAPVIAVYEAVFNDDGSLASIGNLILCRESVVVDPDNPVTETVTFDDEHDYIIYVYANEDTYGEFVLIFDLLIEDIVTIDELPFGIETTLDDVSASIPDLCGTTVTNPQGDFASSFRRGDFASSFRRGDLDVELSVVTDEFQPILIIYRDTAGDGVDTDPSYWEAIDCFSTSAIGVLTIPYTLIDGENYIFVVLGNNGTYGQFIFTIDYDETEVVLPPDDGIIPPTPVDDYPADCGIVNPNGDFASSFRRGDFASAFRRGEADIRMIVESTEIAPIIILEEYDESMILRNTSCISRDTVGNLVLPYRINENYSYQITILANRATSGSFTLRIAVVTVDPIMQLPYTVEGVIAPVPSDVVPADCDISNPQGDFASSFRSGDFASAFRRGDSDTPFSDSVANLQITVESDEIAPVIIIYAINSDGTSSVIDCISSSTIGVLNLPVELVGGADYHFVVLGNNGTFGSFVIEIIDLFRILPISSVPMTSYPILGIDSGEPVPSCGMDATGNFAAAFHSGDFASAFRRGQAGVQFTVTTDEFMPIIAVYEDNDGILTEVACEAWTTLQPTTRNLALLLDESKDYLIIVRANHIGTGNFSFSVNWVDFQAPLTTIIVNPSEPNGLNGWYITNVDINLTAEDNPFGAGVDVIEWSVDGGQTWNLFTGSWLLSVEGEMTLLARAYDVAGNVESPPAEAIIRIDKTPPTIDISTDRDTYTRLDDVVMSIMAEDTLPGSGLSSVVAEFDGQPVTDGSIIDLFAYSLGILTYSATATDIAGWTAMDTGQIEIVATLDSLLALVDYLCAEGLISNDGICNSLRGKVEGAQAAEERGQSHVVINKINALIHQTRAQSGNHMTDEAARILEADASAIILERDGEIRPAEEVVILSLPMMTPTPSPDIVSPTALPSITVSPVDTVTPVISLDSPETEIVPSPTITVETVSPTETIVTTLPDEPTLLPTAVLTDELTLAPTAVPTDIATATPTNEPAPLPTATSTAVPTDEPILLPTVTSTAVPTATVPIVPTETSTIEGMTPTPE